MNASQITKFCLLSTVLLLTGCGLLDDGATKRPTNSGLIATPVSYYSTARARYLGAKYKDNLDRLVERIVRNPKTTSLQFANNISSVGGIGFYTHSVTKGADERFLEVVLAAPETFEAKGGHNDKVNRLFTTYGSELLTILSGDNDIYQDKEMSGYGINLAWRNVIAEPAGSRVILERAIIYLAKEKTRRFLRREITQGELLADATIFAVEEDGPLNLISYRAPETRQEAAPAIREDDIAPAGSAPDPLPAMAPEPAKKEVPAVREPVAKAAPPKPPVTVAQKTKPLPLKPALAAEPVAKPAAPKPVVAPVEVAKLEAPAAAPKVESAPLTVSQAKLIELPAPVVDTLPVPELKPALPMAPPQVETAAPTAMALKPILPPLPPAVVDSVPPAPPEVIAPLPAAPAVVKSAPPALAEVVVKPVPAVMTAPAVKVETKAVETVVAPAPVKPLLPAALPVADNIKPALVEAPARPVLQSPPTPVENKAVELASVPVALTKPVVIELPPAQAAPAIAPTQMVAKPAPVKPIVELSSPAPAIVSAAPPAAEQLASLSVKPPEVAPIKPAIVRPATPRALEGFIIQLGFNDKDRAQRWAEGMEKKGFAVSVTEAGSEGALRVRLGNFTARDDAERQLRAIKQEGLSGIILNLPQGFRPEARSSIP